MGVNLITKKLFGRTIIPLSSILHQGNPLLVVHHVQSLALQLHCTASAVVFPVHFETAEVYAFLLPSTVLTLYHPPRPLSRCIVDIEGCLRCAAVDYLPGCGTQLVFEIPAHRCEMRHLDHVAVGVVGVILRRLPDGSAAQAVARFSWFDQTWLLIAIAPCPVTIGGLVDELLEITDLIVLILLRVVAHRLAVLRVRKIDAELVVPSRFRLGQLANVLAALGLD